MEWYLIVVLVSISLMTNNVWGSRCVLTGHFYLFCDPTYFSEGILQLGEVNLVESIIQIFYIFFLIFLFVLLLLVNLF